MAAYPGVKVVAPAGSSHGTSVTPGDSHSGTPHSYWLPLRQLPLSPFAFFTTFVFTSRVFYRPFPFHSLRCQYIITLKNALFLVDSQALSGIGSCYKALVLNCWPCAVFKAQLGVSNNRPDSVDVAAFLPASSAVPSHVHFKSHSLLSGGGGARL